MTGLAHEIVLIGSGTSMFCMTTASGPSTCCRQLLGTVALTARAFVFFAYPGNISGDRVWTAVDYAKDKLVDGYTGATPLLVISNSAPGTTMQEIVSNSYFSWMDLFVGLVPGSLGETSALACFLGAAILILLGIASWRIMAGMLIGAFSLVSVMNFLAGTASSAFITVPFHYHIVMGGFAFGMVYMATDPVSAAATNAGKWIWGAGDPTLWTVC